MKECTCFINNVERIKEWGRLAQRELDVIINVLETNKPLFMRLVNSDSLTTQAFLEPMRNGLKAKANFSLIAEGTRHFKRLELLDWNKELIYFRPEDITLEKRPGSETTIQLEWKLEIV